MSAAAKDPLLTIAQGLTAVFLAIVTLVTLAMPVAIALLYLHPDAYAELASKTADPARARDAIATLLAAFALLGGLFIAFFLTLRAIIASVGRGDPFVHENAKRIARLGWLVIAEEVLSLLTMGIAEPLLRAFPKENLSVDVEFSPAAILFALVLFILARVFRRGAAMRADLEGTV